MYSICPAIEEQVNQYMCLFQEVISGSSAECNKEKAKDSSNTAGERVGAGIDYAKDKCEEAGHAASKEVNKQKAMH